MNSTNEFSFILKPTNHGVGVFATHDIAEGVQLRLFGDETVEKQNVRVLPTKEVPEAFRNYCGNRGDELWCPLDFGAMHIGWYVNHSSNPNAGHKDFIYYSLRPITAGEEITFDYNTLGEPEEAKEPFYRN